MDLPGNLSVSADNRINYKRFSADFMFQLTANEKAEVVANCYHLKQLKYNIYIVFIYSFNKSE